ncbi:MAG: PAS domain-containing sensor histidine kinase, partial [Turicimonas muris]
MSKYLRLALLIMVGVSCILLFLLVNASRNSGFFEKYYQLLLWVNTGVAAIFLGLVAVLLTRLYQRARKKRYGVKILSKFAFALGLAGVLPGVLIFLVSVQFLYGSVDSWFDRKVERALDSGLTLGREVLENYQFSLLNRARNLAVELAESPPAEWVSRLDSLRERENLSEAMIVTSRGRLIGVSGASFNTLAPVVPSIRNLQTARSEGHWEGLEEKEGGTIQAKAIVLIPTVELPAAA